MNYSVCTLPIGWRINTRHSAYFGCGRHETDWRYGRGWLALTPRSGHARLVVELFRYFSYQSLTSRLSADTVQKSLKRKIDLDRDRLQGYYET
jgi:hypothetical protein